MSHNYHDSVKSACEYIWMTVWCLSILFFIILYLAIIHDYQQQQQQQRKQQIEDWLMFKNNSVYMSDFFP